MSTRQKGYAGQTGLYLPSAACSIPKGTASIVIQGNPIAKQWPSNGVNMHCHLKNIRYSPSGESGGIVTFGSYSANRALAFSVYCWDNGWLDVAITSTTPNGSGSGKYITLQCRRDKADGTIYDSKEARYVYCNHVPQEIEVSLKNGLYSVSADGKTYIEPLGVVSGAFSGVSTIYPIYPAIRKNANASYDLVDFTYETSETSCRFVPMKTADGKDAIYEVYSQQVVEI